MRPPLLIGVVIAAVILVAGILAPALRSAEAKKAERAVAQAILAQRRLARVDSVLPQVAALAEKDPARYEGPAEQSLRAFLEAVKGNADLLQSAIAGARKAVETDANAIGVAHVLGAAQYVRAAGLLGEAEARRAQQAARQAELLKVAAEWKLGHSQADYYRGLDLAPITARLQGELSELAARRSEARERVQRLAEQVQAQERALAEAEAELRAARDALLGVEQESFTAGDDADFERFRAAYQAAARRVRELEQRAHELRYGGRRGAELVGDDLTTAEVRGGETIVGVEELKRQLAAAEDVSRRQENNHISLEDRIRYVTELGQTAAEEIARARESLAAVEARQRAIIEELKATARAASETEDQALSAAGAAATAFAQAQRALDAWVRAADELRRERDPERRNPRLRAIAEAANLKQLGASGEAAARVLAARVHALRAEANRQLIAAMNLYVELGSDPTFEFDPAPFQTLLETARGAGLDTLEKARAIYERLSKEPKPTSWVPLAALAAAHHLTARLDPAQAAPHVAQAAALIQQALDKRAHFPYAQDLLPFLAHMGGAGAAPAPARTEEVGDFFSDSE